MVSVVLLLVTVSSAYVVVIAGAVAFELTGTGFTTRISERVVNNPVRRKIAMLLILLGYGGTATVVASLVASVDTSSVGLSLRNTALLLLGGLALYGLARRIGSQWLGDLIRRRLALRFQEAVPHEELMLYGRNMGITRIEIPHGSAVAGQRLRDVDLRALKLQVLALEDHGQVAPIPDPDWVLRPLQHVVLYGDVTAVQTAFGPADDTTEVVGEAG
jgi:hypothetical protein